MSTWSDPELLRLFQQRTPLIDVRAPVEFAAGRLPGSINLPLMDDRERHLVGICYKERGQAAAIELGHQLVNGEIKRARVQAWAQFIAQHPRAQVLCFRGGLRSQTSCHWLKESGIDRTPIPGGYKRLRQFLLSWLNEAPLPRLVRLGGLTGSGKTDLLATLPDALDLEALAHHRGSAFGSLGEQPGQVTFDNDVALGLIGKSRLVVEDESATLGRLRLPRRLYAAMRSSPLLVLEAPLEERLANIHRDYVLTRGKDFFLRGVGQIERKLGGLRAKQLRDMLEVAFAKGLALEDHAEWMTVLLREYYDPIYLRALEQQKGSILHRGSAADIQSWMADNALGE